MDCLPLLSDRDLQMLGLTLAQRKLVLDAIANMGMKAEPSTGISLLSQDSWQGTVGSMHTCILSGSEIGIGIFLLIMCTRPDVDEIIVLGTP